MQVGVSSDLHERGQCWGSQDLSDGFRILMPGDAPTAHGGLAWPCRSRLLVVRGLSLAISV
jgi:hypothetical protein